MSIIAFDKRVNGSLGDHARRGSFWLIITNGIAKALGGLTQLLLAGIMPRAEFGVYATAISLCVLLSVVRDGGLPTVLMQKSRRFDTYAGPVFWMMLLINSATGAAIALAARPAALFYRQPELQSVIELFALTIPLCVPVSVLSLRLSSAMKFRQLGVVPAVSAVLRSALLLVFAYHGFGAKSFILSMLIGSLFDTALLWFLTRYSPWLHPARCHVWPRLMRAGRWVLLGTFASALGNNGAYFLLAAVMPSDFVGVYFFSFQVVTLLGVLIVDSTYQVLLAAFSRISDDVTRVASAALRAIGAVALTGSAASLAIAVAFRPLDQLLWHGKWASAAGAVTALAVVWPMTAFAKVLYAVQAAAGRFRMWGMVNLGTACASVLGSVTGAVVTHSAAGAAIGYGVGNLALTICNVHYSMSSLNISPASVARIALLPWLVACLAGSIGVSVCIACDNQAEALIASLTVFAAISLGGLRWLANDSLQLVLGSARRALGKRVVTA